MIEDKEEPNEDAGLAGRAALIAMLFAAGFGADGLLDDIRTSILAMSYAACLVVMAVATLRSMGLQWASQLPGTEPTAPPASDWHASHAFTDPLYQIPAVSCIILYFIDLIADLVAEPPESAGARWFLASVTGLVFAAVGGVIWRTGGRNDAGRAESVTELDAEHRPEDGNTSALRDPWFDVPAVVAPVLFLIRPTLRDIEEGPPYVSAWAALIGAVVVGLAAIVTTAVRHRSRRNHASAARDEHSVRVTEEDG